MKSGPVALNAVVRVAQKWSCGTEGVKTDQHTVIHVSQATNHCQHEFILILVHKENENMTSSIRLSWCVRISVNFVWTKTRILPTV